MDDFMTFELILGVATIVLAPIVGRVIDWVLLRLGQWWRNRKASEVYSNIEKLINAHSPGLSPSLLRKVEVAWFKADNHLDHDRAMDTDLRARCRDLLDRARYLIDKTISEKEIGHLESAQELIDYERNLIVEAQGSRGTGFALGLAVAVIVLTVAISPFASATDWKLLGMVPLYVVVFSMVGGIARPLYRYCFPSHQGGFLDPIKVFVITPFLGIIAGAILYLMMDAGLVFVGTSEEANLPLLAIVAFTGGFFCDKPIAIAEKLANTLQRSQEATRSKEQPKDENQEEDK